MGEVSDKPRVAPAANTGIGEENLKMSRVILIGIVMLIANTAQGAHCDVSDVPFETAKTVQDFRTGLKGLSSWTPENCRGSLENFTKAMCREPATSRPPAPRCGRSRRTSANRNTRKNDPGGGRAQSVQRAERCSKLLLIVLNCKLATVWINTL
jgi:hypothetical protein